eukprot:scaffold842_cov227-Pinguiococcus_pyrenoidosus.AAC.7
MHFRAAMGTDRAEVQKVKNTNQDLLTQVDPECQKIIEQHIRDNFPSHGLLGEEDVPPGPDASRKALEKALDEHEWLWIVDPIDGTWILVARKTQRILLTETPQERPTSCMPFRCRQ